MFKIISFGEVLWDNLPTGKVLGGAPVNLLIHLATQGADCSVISRCGNDDDGAALLAAIQRKRVATDLIQTNSQFATSQVLVQLDNEGSAHYDIVYPCAWDEIHASEAAKARVAQSDVFVFGNLAVRDAVSHQALAELLPHATFKIFDVNLRPPHYQFAHLHDMMQQADFIKFNDDELYEIAAALGSPYRSIEQNIRFIAERTHTRQICVTLGKTRRVVLPRWRAVRPPRLPRKRCRYRGRGRQLFGGLYPPIFATQIAARNTCLCLRAWLASGFAARRNA